MQWSNRLTPRRVVAGPPSQGSVLIDYSMRESFVITINLSSHLETGRRRKCYRSPPLSTVNSVTISAVYRIAHSHMVIVYQ